MSRPCGSPTGTRLGVGMAELDLVRPRELAAELGYWPASTDAEHVAQLRAQDARKQTDRDPAKKWAHLTQLMRQREAEAGARAAVADLCE
jgi:hypothetical protein